MRMEPTRSDPYSRKLIPAATAAAAPPEEPPGVRAGSHGLAVAPKSSLAVCPKSPSMKATLVLPTTTAPARRSRRTTVASALATWSRKAGLPQVVLSPATSKLSLMVMGRPCSGPSWPPRAVASSAAAASARACSPRSSTTALSPGLTASIRASWASVSSRDESSRPRSIRATSVAGWVRMSSMALRPSVVGWSSPPVYGLPQGQSQALQLGRVGDDPDPGELGVALGLAVEPGPLVHVPGRGHPLGGVQGHAAPAGRPGPLQAGLEQGPPDPSAAGRRVDGQEPEHGVAGPPLLGPGAQVEGDRPHHPPVLDRHQQGAAVGGPPGRVGHRPEVAGPQGDERVVGILGANSALAATVTRPAASTSASVRASRTSSGLIRSEEHLAWAAELLGVIW